MIAALVSTSPCCSLPLVAFCVVVYVLADGFDLGVGILFLLAPREADRDLMMASVEPVWDGNETWLVMGGTLLLATFPAGYYVLLPAFYLPVMFMLFALIFRGIAFEFRHQAQTYRWVWDFAFAGGSLLATLCQGFILGGLINGVTMRDGMFAGGTFDFFSLLGLVCGLGLVGGYALLGAGWLIWKTDGPTQVFAREVAHSALILTADHDVARQRLERLERPGSRGALVRLAEHRLSRPGAGRHRGRARGDLARALDRAGAPNLHARHRGLSAGLRRARRQPVALCRAAPRHHLGRRRRPPNAVFVGSRDRHHHPDRARLSGPCLLGFPRQDATPRRIWRRRARRHAAVQVSRYESARAAAPLHRRQPDRHPLVARAQRGVAALDNPAAAATNAVRGLRRGEP